MDEWMGKEYVGWLENVLREMVDIEPECIAIEMLDGNGKVYTSYWNVSSDDRARMIGGMQDDDRLEWVRNNRDMIVEVLRDGEEGEDE